MNELSNLIQTDTVQEMHRQLFQPKQHATHKIKCDLMFFEALDSGLKTAELRYNDRDYKMGDQLIILEHDRKMERFTGRALTFTITDVLDDTYYGLKDGYVMLSLRKNEMFQ